MQVGLFREAAYVRVYWGELDWLFRDRAVISLCRDSSIFRSFYHGHGLGFAGCQVLILFSDDGMQRVRLLENVSGRSLI